MWVYGERAIYAARPYLPETFHLAEAKRLLFTGHCSETDVAQLAKESGDNRSVVIGVGGGTLLDTAKALARRLDLPFVGIPTIAATCAAGRRSPSGITMQAALHFEIFPDANFLVLVEPGSFSMRQRNIYWRGSATRWRSGTRPSCLRLSRKTCH